MPEDSAAELLAAKVGAVDWGDVPTWIGSVSTTLALIAAGAAAWFAHRAATSTHQMLRIERERRHGELVPQFDVSAERRGGSTAVVLVLRLRGPQTLRRLDALTVVIRDDKERTAREGAGYTQEQLDEQIWGPYMFRPSVDHSDRLGRTSGPLPLLIDEERIITLQETQPPPWQASSTALESWRRDYAEAPIRLLLKCEREGYEPWEIPVEVDQPAT